MSEEIVFLTVEQVIELHARTVGAHSPGESHAIRDMGLLESAVMSPKHTWGGEYIYSTIAEMAAQYLISLNQNHAFENGNKRAAFTACSTFLGLNGFELEITHDNAVALTLAVASHSIEKDAVVQQITDAVQPLC